MCVPTVAGLIASCSAIIPWSRPCASRRSTSCSRVGQRGERRRSGRSCGLRPARLCDQPAQPRDQLLRIDGLDEVVVGADQQPDHPIGSFTSFAAHEHDRQLFAVPLPQVAANLIAGRSREDHIEDDRSGRKRGHRLDRLLTAREVVSYEPRAVQCADDEFRVRGIGVDDDDVGSGHELCLFALLQEAPRQVDQEFAPAPPQRGRSQSAAALFLH